MTQSTAAQPSQRSLTLLSLMLFSRDGDARAASQSGDTARELLALTRSEFDDLVHLASLNHVIVRGLEVFLKFANQAGDAMRIEWAESALNAERARIATAVDFLYEICTAFESNGYNVAVIKSLDHWPDLGSDLDLYTNAKSDEISSMMNGRFGAQIAPRSWGDRLAHKWNFEIPGLPEAVEVHMGRLGQTGEQLVIANSLMARSRQVKIGALTFRVPSISDRIMISTLQRMYRHFYFRLCDIVDSAMLVEAGGIDFADLHSAASAAGIWEGVAAYLAIVSDYVKKYRGTALNLPEDVKASARFGGEVVYYSRSFIRVPIMPQSAGLYRTQLAGFIRKREVASSARLSLLPWLATAAVVGQKVTGSDKGIW